MSNTYAINVTRGQEFAVEAELKRIGGTPWVARRLDSKYIKERRAYTWFDVPYVPKLVFCVFPAVLWSDVRAIKDIIGKPIALGRGDIRGVKAHTIKRQNGTEKHIPATYGLEDFRDAVAAEYADADRARVNSEYECKYAPGDALQILSGTFEGLDAEFDRTMKHAHNGYAKLRVKVHVMGATVSVDIDPDMVRSN